VAHTLSFMYAPHEHGRYLFFHRVLSMACPGSLTAADIKKDDVGATREKQPASSPLSRLAGTRKGCSLPTG
jgi:hypothetical protein